LKMTRSKRSVIPFLVPRGKVWLTPTAQVPCSNASNIGERETWTQSEFLHVAEFRHGTIKEPPKVYTAEYRAKFG